MTVGPVWLMTVASVGSWLMLALVLDREGAGAVLAGMLGPLAAAVASWRVTEWTFRRNPAGVTAVMMAAFGIKVVFFGAYVVVVLRGLGVRPMPFVAGFTGYFVALYAIEALYLKRLFAGAPGGGPQSPAPQIDR